LTPQGVAGSGDVPSNLDNAERWRKLAEEARAVAEQLTDLDAKQIMLRIAEGYELLTRRAEARKKNSD
jgi:hypothetical protein